MNEYYGRHCSNPICRRVWGSLPVCTLSFTTSASNFRCCAGQNTNENETSAIPNSRPKPQDLWDCNQTRSMVKGKVQQSLYMPGQALRVPGSWSSQISRQLSHEGGKFVSPTHVFTPQEIFLVLISGRGWVNPKAIMRTECKLKISKKNSSDTIVNRTRGLPTCSEVPQPTAPPCPPPPFIWSAKYSAYSNIHGGDGSIFNFSKLCLRAEF